MSCWALSQQLPSCPSVNPYTLASVTDRPLICALARWFWMKETPLTTILYWIFKQLSSSTSYIFSFGRRSKKGQQSKEEWTFLFLVTKPVTAGTPGLPLVPYHCWARRNPETWALQLSLQAAPSHHAHSATACRLRHHGSVSLGNIFYFRILKGTVNAILISR